MGLVGWMAARSQYYCSVAVPTLQCIAAAAFASLPALRCLLLTLLFAEKGSINEHQRNGIMHLLFDYQML